MPIPIPLAEETDQDFVTRCMNDAMMKDEFADLNDRLNICSIQARYKTEQKPGENLSRLRVGFRSSPGHQVNQGSGTISDISLIEVGEARGHELWIDEKSLETAVEVLGSNLPAYITHKGALEEDRILKEVGYFSEFYVDGEKLKAKNFKALGSFQNDESDRFNRLFDIASEMPDTFGVSLVFEAEVVHVMDDGSEILVHEMLEDDFKNAVRAFPSVRFKSIKSADFVDAPASNRAGLFSAQTHQGQKMEKAEALEEIVEEEIVEEQLEETPQEQPEENQDDPIDYQAKILDLEGRITELEGKLSEEQKINETLSELIEGEDPIDEESENQIEEVSIAEKFASAQGAEATELFRSHKSEIRKLFNQSRRS